MALCSLSGTASHILRARDRAGASGDWNPELTSRNGCSFRIGSRSVRMSLHERPRLEDGDHVTVVGSETARGFVGYAMRNDSAGISHCASEVPTWALYVGGALAVLVGIPFSPMLIGIPVLAAGVWVLYLAHRNSRALAMLDAMLSTPHPEAPVLRFVAASSRSAMSEQPVDEDEEHERREDAAAELPGDQSGETAASGALHVMPSLPEWRARAPR